MTNRRSPSTPSSNKQGMGRRRSASIPRFPTETILGWLSFLFAVSLIPAGSWRSTLPFVSALHDTGPGNLKEGLRLFQEGSFDAAASHLWRAVLLHSQSPEGSYTVEEAFTPFIRCYAARGRLADGFFFVAKESFGRGQTDMGKMYLDQTLSAEPDHSEALELKRSLGWLDDDDDEEDDKDFWDSFTRSGDDDDGSGPWDGKSPEELYAMGTDFFSDKRYEECAAVFDLSCVKSNRQIGPACTNAVYCRNMVVDWGFNGTQFVKDMQTIEGITRLEVQQFRVEEPDGKFKWRRATSTHPHMMLGYPIDSMLKRYVTESAAFLDELIARAEDGTTIKQLPSDLPYNQDDNRAKFIFDAAEKDFRIKVGFVASAFNSKAVLYLSHDMFRFFDSDKFEVHVFSLGAPDNPMFIAHAMRGVDWRERVKSNADYFHDLQHLKNDHINLAQFIHGKGMHILIEWDGYARQGERAQGLFALRPAPVQILHQEYLGTSGAQYVDYIFTDRITSPEKLEGLYTEKLIYMPNHFFSKGHAVQAEVKPPSYEYSPKQTPYVLGTGSPIENRCLSPSDEGPKIPSIVYCNFNKFLKNNPQTVRSWIRILREVPNSILCLLENPADGVPYLRKFIHEAAGTSFLDGDESTFLEGDGDDLNERVHFLPWQANPFDHQMRNHDFCNVMLDSHPYNGHTVAQDSLYGGVPIVTRSDGDDMSSRVSTSANVVLGLEELNAYDGPSQYEDIAIKLGLDREWYGTVRRRLVGTCLKKNPMHPYWDVRRYVRNFETGLRHAWDLYLSGKPPEHIYIEEDEETKRGSYEKDLVTSRVKRKVRHRVETAGATTSNEEL